MPRFHLSCTESSDELLSPYSKNTLEFDAVTLSEVTQYMEQFLKGCGFVFSGTLDIVPHDWELPEFSEDEGFADSPLPDIKYPYPNYPDDYPWEWTVNELEKANTVVITPDAD